MYTWFKDFYLFGTPKTIKKLYLCLLINCTIILYYIKMLVIKWYKCTVTYSKYSNYANYFLLTYTYDFSSY